MKKNEKRGGNFRVIFRWIIYHHWPHSSDQNRCTNKYTLDADHTHHKEVEEKFIGVVKILTDVC
jgi:hypothetical protein